MDQVIEQDSIKEKAALKRVRSGANVLKRGLSSSNLSVLKRGTSITNNISRKESLIIEETISSNTDIINQKQDIKPNKKQKKQELSLDDWFVLDISSSMNEQPYVNTVDRLLKAVSGCTFYLANHGIYRIPKQLFFLFEMETLKQLTPQTLTSNFLISVENDVFTLSDTFDAWLARKINQNKFYLRLQETLQLLFVTFFQQTMRFFSLKLASKKVIYRVEQLGVGWGGEGEVGRGSRIWG